VAVRWQVHSGHSARWAPLRPNNRRGEVEQLGTRAHENELSRLWRLHRSDDLVLRFETDDFEVRLVRPVAGAHALDDALAGSESDGVRTLERDQSKDPFSFVREREVVDNR
jgi:hypothetical protein